MKIKKSGPLRGELRVAPDKSISHRGVMLGAIAQGDTVIENFLTGEDCLSTISCFEKLGIDVEREGTTVTVHGKGMHGLRAPSEVLYTGNSGTTTRLLCGLLSAQDFACTLDGDASIRRRPMDRVIVPLSRMGADITGVGGNYAPLSIHGSKLHGITYDMPVASAQLKSSLILAGLYAEGETVLTEPNPSRNHTELMLNGFGGHIESEGCKVTVHPVGQLYGGKVQVPGDISSAAFFLAAGLIVPGSQLVIRDVGLNPTRTGVIEVLRAMGGDIRIENERNEMEPMGDIVVTASSLHGTEVGGSLIPRLIDELPIIAAVAAFAQGETVIRDAQELKVKESNRIDAMARELARAGVDVTATDDGLVIRGGQPVHGADFCSYADHRVAMSMAVLALAAEGESSIDDPACIRISYPDFAQNLKDLGGEVQL